VHGEKQSLQASPPQPLPSRQSRSVQRQNRIMPTLVDVIPASASARPEATIYVSTPIEPYTDDVVCLAPYDGGTPICNRDLRRDLSRAVTNVYNGRHL
jgi:hypothetical protein